MCPKPSWSSSVEAQIMRIRSSQPEPRRHTLVRRHRLVTLSGACRADKHMKGPIPVEANARLLLQSARAALYEGSKSDAVAATFNHAALQGMLLDLPPDLVQRLFEHRSKIAGIRNCAGGS